MSDVPGNPEDRVSRDEAQIICEKYPLEIQHPKYENGGLGFIESVYER